MRKSDKMIADENTRIKATINYMMVCKHTDEERCALAIGCSPRTFKRRLENPGELNLDELRALARLWGCTAQKIMCGEVSV